MLSDAGSVICIGVLTRQALVYVQVLLGSGLFPKGTGFLWCSDSENGFKCLLTTNVSRECHSDSGLFVSREMVNEKRGSSAVFFKRAQ